MFQMVVAILYVNLRDIGAVLNLKWHNLEKSGSSVEHSAEFFLKSPKTDYKLIEMVQIYLPMSLRIFGNVI